MKRREMELLAPGGDVDSIKAAVTAGANAIYCGLDRFNARNRAVNISFDDLQGILHFAHKHSCEIFLTINIIVVENEIPAFISLMNRLVNTSIDGVIVQDLGMFYLLQNYFPSLNVHASTQCTTHNAGQIPFLKKLGATRVNLSRELNIREIAHLTGIAHENSMETEVFVHGSNCISFSGLCYISSLYGGNSGNRGRCSQPCRDEYKLTEAGKRYPLNLKDNSAFADLEELANAGVDSLKIEGRIKKFHYVYKVVDTWRKQLDNFYETGSVSDDKSDLYTVFNRDFSNTFLKGDISRDMFIDNPRDNSAVHYADGSSDPQQIDRAKREVYDIRTGIIQRAEEEIGTLSIAKVPLHIEVTGTAGSPLKMKFASEDLNFEISSELSLRESGKRDDFSHLTKNALEKRFKTISDSEYLVNSFDVQVSPDLYLPVKDLNLLKQRALAAVFGSDKIHPPVNLPILKQEREPEKPGLAVLVSTPEDLDRAKEHSGEIFYEIPSSIGGNYESLLTLFRENSAVIPWFSSVIIGDEYDQTVAFLRELSPKRIVTNNSGIGYEAYLLGIEWVAGPWINCVNSYSLIALQEKFNCAGAFISNEISKVQLKKIKRPAGFKLYYSIYHPIVLMTSRQCFFHQVSGCEKAHLDGTCISGCERHGSITNMSDTVFRIDKRKGHYHTINNECNYLNCDVVNDFPDLFGSYMLDLRNVSGDSQARESTISMFQKFLQGGMSGGEVKEVLAPNTSVQYKKGI